MAQWSLDFDGTNDYVGCGDLPGGTGALTVECWVRLDVDYAVQGIICKWDSADAAQQEYSLEADASGYYVFKITTATAGYSVSAQEVVAGTWQHVAGVYDGDELRLYVDGVEADTDGDATGNIIATTQPLEFGRTDALEYMDGGLAYVRISNAARYTTTFTVPKIPAFIDANTLGQWDFIEGRPFTALNNRKGVAAYDGSITGATWSLDIPEGMWSDSYDRWGDAWTIFVDSIDRTSVVALDSLVITMETGSSRDTAKFNIENVTTAVTLEAWQPVQIWHGGKLMFGGVLVAYDVIPRGITRDLICDCVDWTALLGKRWKDPEEYVAQTCAAILADVYAEAATEINATAYVEAGETIDFEVSFDYLDDITNQLAEASGFVWYVRENEEGIINLYFQAETASNRSAFDLSTSPDMVTTFPMQVVSWPVSGSEIINYVQFVITEDDNTQTLTGTQNILSIAKYGQLEWVGKISRSQAETYTTEWLADAAYERTSGQIRIWQSGIMPGTYINIEHSVLDVNDTYLVTSVVVRPEGGSAVAFDLAVGSVDVGLSNHLSSLRRVSVGTDPIVSSAAAFPYGIITESIRPFADSVAGLTLQNATGIALVTLDTVSNIFKPLGYIDGGMYASGTSGYRMNGLTGDAEFNNVTLRGALAVTTLQYGQVLATNGSIWITPVAGRSLAAIMSVDSPATFDVDIEDPDGLAHVAAGAMWVINDIIRIKEPLGGDLWAKISSKSDQTTFWRLVCVKQSPGAGTNYTFTAGGAVLNYGQSGAGMIRLTADATNSPYISIATHAGSPWATLTERARLGNLTGISGASGYGLWTDNGYFTGTVSASAGDIAGWTIASGHLYAGTGASRTGMKPGTYPFYAGAEDETAAPFRVTAAGAITASSGTIGGWTLGASSLTAGSGANTVGVDSGGTNPAFYAGSATPGSAPFRVTTTGALTATNATITGVITATGGDIAGWMVASGHLFAGTGASRAGMKPGTYPFYAGAEDETAAPFRVTAAGALTATSATISGAITATSGSIAGWTIASGHLYAGTGASRAGMKPGTYPFYAGAEDETAAPFRVTVAGALTATSATITGAITASSGSLTGFLSLGGSGGIYQGSGTAGSPTTGLKIWNDSTIGRIAGYNATVLQWYANTDGKLYAGGGAIVLDENGATVTISTSNGGATQNSYKFKTAGGTETTYWRVYDYGSVLTSYFYNSATALTSGAATNIGTLASYSGTSANTNIQSTFGGNQPTVGLSASNSTSAINIRSATISIDGNSGLNADAAMTVYGQMTIDQSNASAAKPVLTIEQSDVSEEFIRFIGTSTTTATQTLADAADLTTPGAVVGWLKIYVQDDQATNPITDGVYWIPFYSAPTA